MLARALAVVAAVAVPMLIVYALIPETVLRLAFGPETVVAADALFVLGIAMTLLAVGYLGVQYMLALGPRRVPARAGRRRGRRDRAAGRDRDGLAARLRRDRARPAGRRRAVGAGDRARPGPPRGRRAMSEPRADGAAARVAATSRAGSTRGAGRGGCCGGAGARARAVGRDGAVVEIGSFRGRSTVVLALAAGAVVAIDPHAGSDRGPQEIAADAARGDADHEAFHGQPRGRGRRRPRAPRAQVLLRRARRRRPARCRCSTSTARTASGRRGRTSRLGRARGARRDDARARRVLLDRRHARAARGLRRSRRLALRRAGPAAWPSTSAAPPERPRASSRATSRELPYFARNVAIKVLVRGGAAALGGADRARPGRPMALLSAEDRTARRPRPRPSGRRSGRSSTRGCSRRGSRAG